MGVHLKKKAVERAVHIIDNGIRSYVPPNFCWELRDSEDRLFQIVSEVDFSFLALQPTEAETIFGKLIQKKILAKGVIEEYVAEPTGKIGKRFFVREVVDL